MAGPPEPNGPAVGGEGPTKRKEPWSGSRRSQAPPAIAGQPEIVLGLAWLGISIGLALWLSGWPAAAGAAWAATTVIALLPLTWSIVRDLRHGEFGVDLIALLAMAGSLALGLAGMDGSWTRLKDARMTGWKSRAS